MCVCVCVWDAGNREDDGRRNDASHALKHSTCLQVSHIVYSHSHVTCSPEVHDGRDAATLSARD